MWGRTYAVWSTKARKEVKETIEILSVNTILFTYRSCSIWTPPTSIHFLYHLIMSHWTLRKIPGISRKTQTATCICATRSCCVSIWMTPLARDWLYVEASSLTWPDTIGFPFLGVHENPGVRDSSGDTTRSCGTNASSSWSHPWNAGKCSAWHNQTIYKMYQSLWQPYWVPSVSE